MCCEFKDNNSIKIAISKAKTEKDVYRLAVKLLFDLIQVA